MKKLKRFFTILLILIASFAVYIQIDNRNAKNMTYRQKFLKTMYPAFMWFTKLTGTNSTKLVNEKTKAMVSFYTLQQQLNNGDILNFESLKGKKVLLVNTASNCGYTDQYSDLQKLYEANKDKLVIIAFPANDFKEQEKGTDTEIAQFCKINYGVTFPLTKKVSVIKGANQNEIFKWLTDATKNGWNTKEPTWNFSKYLINEQGELTNYFDPSVSPSSVEVLDAIKN